MAPRSGNAPALAIQNRQRVLRLDLPRLKENGQKIMAAAWKLPNKRSPLRDLDSVHVLLISDRRMATLHRRFLGQSGPTDVITFAHGEIFISVETAMKNARRFRNPLVRELSLYIAHGLLHLHGFDDADARAARRMERVQEEIVNSLI